MPLSVGSRAPDFTLYDTSRKARSSTEFFGKKTVIAFFPAAFTSVCTRELCTFRDSMARLSDAGAQVVGISVDSPFANRAFAESNKLGFPILSDYTREVVNKFGVAHNGFGGLPGYVAAYRSVFVIDKGIVTYVWVTENPGIEPPYSEVMKALAASD